MVTAVHPDADRRTRRVLWWGRGVAIVLTGVFLLLLGRVVQLQQQPHAGVTERLRRQASDVPLSARRGAILDRRGRPLTQTRTTLRLFVDPALIEDHGVFGEEVARRGGASLRLDPLEVERRVSARPGSRYVVLADGITGTAALAAEEVVRAVPGVGLEQRLERSHPHGTVASQLLGFVGTDGHGQEGMERALDAELLGSSGRRPMFRDAQRRPLWTVGRRYHPQADGRTARLTLDLNLQRLGERLLAETLETYEADSGQLIAMDPRTGEILALANAPAFDPEANRSAPDAWRNRAVTDAVEPGSVMKPLVWAAALELGLTEPEEVFDTTLRGWWKPRRGPVLRDAHPHGELTWDGVLVRSSNIGMAMVAERMGRPQLDRVLRDFGFGTATGSGIPGEAAGMLRRVEDWSWTDLSRLPMGQGIAVTPIQMVRGFCAVANGGLLVQPRIRIDGEPPDTVLSPPARVLSPEVAEHTKRVLRRVVTEGTGRHARSDRFKIFGKTGTAQLPDLIRGGYEAEGYLSCFIGGGPLANPRLVVGVFIQRPDKKIGHYGGVVAGPPAKAFLEQALHYLGETADVEGDTEAGAQQVASTR